MSLHTAAIRLSLLCLIFLCADCKKKKKEPEPPTPSPTITYLSAYTGTTNMEITGTFQTSFESLSDLSGFFITPNPHLSTTEHALSTDKVHSGTSAHKAWFNGANSVVAGQNTNHRGYPAIQLHKLPKGTFHGLTYTEFWVNLDITLENSANKDWFSFATFTAYSDDQWQRTLLVNLSKDGYVHLAHVPNQGQHTPNQYQNTSLLFPMQEWVKLSILIDYSSDNSYNAPFAKVWQNDQLVSISTFNPRLDMAYIAPADYPPCLSNWTGGTIEAAEDSCDLVYTGGLAQAHFGMYAPPLITSGTVYNDDLVIYELTRK